MTKLDKRPRGFSLHFGVNYVNPKVYGKVPALRVCENDAIAMQKIAKNKGFTSEIYLSKDATATILFSKLLHFSENLHAGDILFISFSGHGYYQNDLIDADEKDGKDEGWCMFERKVLDDELFEMWHKFKPGVRILVVSDSCFSGGVIKNNTSVTRVVKEREAPKCTVKLLAGTLESIKARESLRNGLYTKNLLLVWDDGKFEGNYEDLKRRIGQSMSKIQQSIHLTIGQKNPAFDNSHPFTIDISKS